MVVMSKRGADNDQLVEIPQASKRTRNEIENYKDKILASAGVERTSNLFAPIMQLQGHKGDIFSCDFHPYGDYLVSTGFDRQIFLWSVFGEECQNISVMSGHKGAVMEIHFNASGDNLYSCSTDKFLSVWDVPTATRIRKMKGHQNFVNSVMNTRRGLPMLVSGSDDCTIRIWDARRKQVCHTFQNNYPITAVCFNDTAENIITGGIDNEIRIWDIRKNEILHKLQGHTDTVTGLSLSPCGSYLLSNSMDNSLKIWDIRPFAPQDRCVKSFQGHSHNFEKNLLRCCWSNDGSKVSCGSSDRFVYIWDVLTQRLLYKLPGHNGSVNETKFHSKEPIILSGSSDKTLYMGELDI